MNLNPHHQSAPVNHTFYGGAHLFELETFPKIVEHATAFYRSLFPTAIDLKKLKIFADLTDAQCTNIFNTAMLKLAKNVEDFRIDFEDGFGLRSGDEEDQYAKKTGEIAAKVQTNSECRMGLRLKSPERATLQRIKRTFKIFFDAYFKAKQIVEPGSHFVVTLPKVESLKSVQHFSNFVRQYCRKKKIPNAFFKFEIMAETTKLVATNQSTVQLTKIVDYLGSKLLGIHIGVYDYLSQLKIPPHAQNQNHPYIVQLEYFLLNNFSKYEISDGVYQEIPSLRDSVEAREIVNKQCEIILAKYDRGIYQGWDIHPHQLVGRFLAKAYFFEKHLESIQTRYDHFKNSGEKAQKLGVIFDDAASVIGLEDFIRRSKSS